jgi:LmbE family N-acetylglucosaminyl deacetylase
MGRKRVLLKILLGVPLLLSGCRNNENPEPAYDGGTICAVLAHPDDETIISGTLTMLSYHDFQICLIYVTSGDNGPDETGRGLQGKDLAQVREAEVLDALQSIDIEIQPVFLRYPDGHVLDHVNAVMRSIKTVMDSIKPNIVIGFGPDGITGDRDHQSTGVATDEVFDQTDYGNLLLHMAITKPLPPFYANGVPVPKKDVDVWVNVARYHKQRAQVVESHHTQFNSRVRSSFRVLVHTMRKEKFIVAGNRSGDEWLKVFL